MLQKITRQKTIYKTENQQLFLKIIKKKPKHWLGINLYYFQFCECFSKVFFWKRDLFDIASKEDL